MFLAMCDFIPQLAKSLPKQTPFIASALFRGFDFEKPKKTRTRGGNCGSVAS